MDELLTVSSTRRFKKDGLQPSSADQTSTQSNKHAVKLKSADDVLEALRSQPSLEVLTRCLKWLVETSTPTSDFSIKVPSAKAAQVVFALANDVLANFWPVLKDDPVVERTKPGRSFIICLSSLAGIGALVTRLKALTQTLKDGAKAAPAVNKRPSESVHATETTDFLQVMLEKDSFLHMVWQDIEKLITKPILRDLAWKELVSWLSSGKLVAVTAEANSVNSWSTIEENDGLWITDGSLYAQWLGRNIMAAAVKTGCADPKQVKQLAQLLGKSLSLGYADELVGTILSACIAGEFEHIALVRALIEVLPSINRRAIVFSTLRVLAKRLAPLSKEHAASVAPGMAFLIGAIFLYSRECIQGLQSWIVGAAGGGVGVDIGIHKAIIAAFASRKSLEDTGAMHAESIKPSVLEETLQKVLTQFGSQYFIKHSPVLNQEVCAQDLLLLFGQVHRLDTDAALDTARSSVYISAISNRLAASSNRAQVLGMIVGTVVSDMADTADKKMKFDLGKLDPIERDFFFSLARESLSVGSLQDLQALADTPKAVSISKRPNNRNQKEDQQKALESAKAPKVEVLGEESDQDDDLPTYAKPDSDQEDEDEDPTVIQRNKPTAPVYIRDLIAGLRDAENYDRHRLALSSAADLIRRKTNFGTEVSNNIEDLATQLVGLKDSYDMEDFQEMRLRGMIAVVVARPIQMGQWYSNTLFNGDYSMSQRASILTALSLAARELAGYREEDSALTGAVVANKDLFPSKRLPEKVERRYAAEMLPVDELSKKLEQAIIKPMALEAADKATGPNILKVRTFSSRMEVEKKRKRPIANDLAKIVADGFFFPLTGRFRANIQFQGDRSAFSTPFLQAHFLKTLALVLSASGPSTLSLLALTTEFWSLLLFMREAALNAQPVMEALLFSFLTVLEINGNDPRRIAEDHGPELVETQEWVERVFENMRGGSDEGDKARVLAAGVLVRTKEIVDKYQRMLLGNVMDYK